MASKSGPTDFSKARIISQEPLESKDAKWIKLSSLTYADPTGRERKWEVAERSTRPKGSSVDAVGIVAILEDPSNPSPDGPSILLEKQYRAPVNKVCIEVPAGLVDPNETLETCALRELFEETGYRGEILRHTGGTASAEHQSPLVLWNDPGFCNTNTCMIHVRVDLTKPENENPKAALEDGEFIDTFAVPIRKLPEECRRLEEEGYAIDARVGTLAEGIELGRRFLGI